MIRVWVSIWDRVIVKVIAAVRVSEELGLGSG